MRRFNVIFCGTPDFSVPTLDLLANNPHINLKAVISMPDRPAGRGQQLKSPPVAEYAITHKINLFQTENLNKDDEIKNFVENEQIDFIVVLAFAQFLGSFYLNTPKYGCFNIHTSLLPKYRGAAPIQYALLNGDSETGVSIQRMVKQMDAGDIVHSFPMPIAPTETGGQLYTRLKFQAALSMNIFINKLLDDQVTYTKQDESLVSFAPTLKKDDGHLKFSELGFSEVQNKIRGLYPWPGTYCFLNSKRLKVFEVEKFNKNLSPGEVDISLGVLLVGCKNATIRIKTAQIAGKKMASDKDIINGLKGNLTLE